MRHTNTSQKTNQNLVHESANQHHQLVLRNFVARSLHKMVKQTRSSQPLLCSYLQIKSLTKEAEKNLHKIGPALLPRHLVLSMSSDKTRSFVDVGKTNSSHLKDCSKLEISTVQATKFSHPHQCGKLGSSRRISRKSHDLFHILGIAIQQHLALWTHFQQNRNESLETRAHGQIKIRLSITVKKKIRKMSSFFFFLFLFFSYAAQKYAKTSSLLCTMRRSKISIRGLQVCSSSRTENKMTIASSFMLSLESSAHS